MPAMSPPGKAAPVAFTKINQSLNVAAMKTTLDIPAPLLREARKLAARKRTTLRALVERGLRRVIAEDKRRPRFRLRDGSFKGRGLQPGLRSAGWEQLRDLIYEGRGG
jgi:hypothetical protein